MIQANCRAQFTADDFSFVVRTLARSQRDAVSLVSLLSDEAERDAILDHELVYRSLIDDDGCLRVSAAFYFYVLTRRVLRQVGLEERALTDYVAAVLLAFSKTSQLRTHNDSPAVARSFMYVSDLLTQLASCPPEQAYMQRTHMANYTLFFSGMFAERIQSHAARRGAPRPQLLRIGRPVRLPACGGSSPGAADRSAHRFRAARQRISQRARGAQSADRLAAASARDAGHPADAAMTLLREIQLLLERTYAAVPVNLEHCLIGESRCATLTRLAGPAAADLAPAGRTFLRQEGEALHLAIFYSGPVIAELETNDPRRTINERNIAPLITFIEEIAHGVQAALLFLEGERAIETRTMHATWRFRRAWIRTWS